MTAASVPTRKARARAKSGRIGPGARSVFTVNLLLILGCLYMVLPLIWLLISATKNSADLYGTGGFTLGDFNLVSNIEAVADAQDGIFWRWMVNSILYAGSGAVIGGFVCVMAGYAFDKISFAGKNKLFGCVLVGVLIPNTATVIPLYLLASEVHLTNTIWSVILPSLCNPFGVYLARIFSAGYVPNETLEAARVDGAGPIRAFWSVALPMLRPGYVTIGLFQFVAIWNNFMLPLVMLQTNKLFPVSLGMSIWQGYTKPQPEFMPLVITGSLLSILPLVVAFLLLQRFWKSGLTAGSVK